MPMKNFKRYIKQHHLAPLLIAFAVACTVAATEREDLEEVIQAVTEIDDLHLRELRWSPIETWGGGATNLATGHIHNYAPTNWQTKTVHVLRGGDNEATRITGFSSTG